jgi:hypothetical protein
MFFRQLEDAVFSYPIPNQREINDCYVKGVRKKFKLTEKDGTTDEDFFGRE